jgi:Flp pilus assembly protein TadG
MSPERRRSPGQIVVMFGIGLLAIVLSVGLVVDGGTAFLERRGAQNDADVATVAGTRVVADAYTDSERPDRSRGDVYAAISASMTRNGCVVTGPASCTWQARFVGRSQKDLGPVVAGAALGIRGSGILGVRVDVTRRPQTYFLGLIGQSSWKVETTATALATRPKQAPSGQLLPIALKEPVVPFQAGQVYDVTAGKTTPGGFVWLSWNGSNSGGTLKSSVCSPNNSAFSMGASISAGPVAAAPGDITCISDWIRSKSTVLIPIFTNEIDAKLPATYKIQRLAAFVITGQPTADELRVYFVGSYGYPSAAAGTGDDPPDDTDSLYYVGLVK